ncbi:MAG: hypothetical protein JO147_01300 [Actinobacteria bacterium]|nr:hypothetical protein [Actinomycetota bacterium]
MTLLVLVGSVATSIRSRLIAAPVALVAATVVWMFVNEPLEGPTLWVTAAGHRFTLADAVTPILLGVATVRVVQLARPPERPTRRNIS